MALDRGMLKICNIFVLAGLLINVPPVHASEQQRVIDLARTIYGSISLYEDFKPFGTLMRKAKGVFIVPEMPRVGFIIGTGGATGVFLRRLPHSNNWSQPVFYHFGLGSIELLFYPEIWNIILLAMTDRAMDGFLSGNFTLGNDMRFAIDPNPNGTTHSESDEFIDIYAYATSRDTTSNLLLSGSSIWAVSKWNIDYYGANVSLKQILSDNVSAKESGTQILRDALPSR